MERLCPHICSTKAFKGKGALRRLARQSGLDLDRIEAEMRQLARASKLDAGFHYLALHRRRSGYGTPCSLRWRSALHRHVPWQSVERDLPRLPVGLHEAYRELNRRATELNVLYRLMHGQRTKLEGLAQARTMGKAKRVFAHESSTRECLSTDR